MSLDNLMPPTDDVLEQALNWLNFGISVAIATVVFSWGSSPRPAGNHLCVREDGAIIGSVSGGCVERAVVHEAQKILKGGGTTVFDYGVTDEMAWEVGLACGGEIRILVRNLNGVTRHYRTARERLRAGQISAVVTRFSDGASALVVNGSAEGLLKVLPAVMDETVQAIHQNQSCLAVDQDPLFHRSRENAATPGRLLLYEFIRNLDPDVYGGQTGQMVFQTRTNVQNQAIGWLSKGYIFHDGGMVLRFSRIWMLSGKCQLRWSSGTISVQTGRR